MKSELKDLGFASISAVNQYLRYAKHKGLDVQRLVQQAGISNAVLAQSSGRIKGLQFQKLIRGISELAKDPLLGLNSSYFVQTESYDIMGPMVLNCQNLGEAIDLIPRFERLVGDMGTTSITKRETECTLTWRCAYTDKSITPHMIDNVLASWTQFARWLTQTNSSAHKINLTRPTPKPEIRERYLEVFQCEIDFESERNRIYLDTELLKTPIAFGKSKHSHTSMSQLSGKASSAMATLITKDDESFTDKIRRSIRAHLQLGSIQKNLIAQEHCVSERTLQRKLEQEGTRYQHLVDKERFVRAKEMLKQSDFSIHDIAYNLGFSDERSFYRRFRTWAKVGPGEFRTQELENKNS